MVVVIELKHQPVNEEGYYGTPIHVKEVELHTTHTTPKTAEIKLWRVKQGQKFYYFHEFYYDFDRDRLVHVFTDVP